MPYHLHAQVRDLDLRAKLLPDCPVGCKRPLQPMSWFPTFVLPNVGLETSPILEFTEQGLVIADGVEHRADTVIYRTGFRAANCDNYFRHPREGRHLVSLHRQGVRRSDRGGGLDAFEPELLPSEMAPGWA